MARKQLMRRGPRRALRAVAVAAALSMSGCGAPLPDRLGDICRGDVVYCDLCGLHDVFRSEGALFERARGISGLQSGSGSRSAMMRFRITDIEGFLSVLGRSYELPADISGAQSIVVAGRVSQGSGDASFVDQGDGRESVDLTYATERGVRTIELGIGPCLNGIFFGAREYRQDRARAGREGADPAGYCERY